MFTLVAHGTAWSTSSNGFTTGGGGGIASLDTTGADFIVMVLGFDSATVPTITDIFSNTYVALTAQPGGQNRTCQIIYCINPTVGSGHTFTVSGSSDFPSMCISAWSGSNLSAPFDQQNGAGLGFGTSLQTGSVTPSGANQLIICGLSKTSPATASIDSSLTVLDGITDSAFGHTDTSLAYEIQTTATTRNPTWSWTGAEQAEAAIATFIAGAAGPTDPFPVAYKPWYQRTPPNMRTLLAR